MKLAFLDSWDGNPQEKEERNRLILLYKGLKGKASVPTDDLILKTRRARNQHSMAFRERGGSVVECRTPEREVRGSRPTAAVLCPWARHFTPRKYWLITQEAMAPSLHDWKIVDWDVKPQHNQIYGISDSHC